MQYGILSAICSYNTSYFIQVVGVFKQLLPSSGFEDNFNIVSKAHVTVLHLLILHGMRSNEKGCEKAVKNCLCKLTGGYLSSFSDSVTLLSIFLTKRILTIIFVKMRLMWLCLTLSAPQDVIHITKTRSRLRVWVGIVHIYMNFQFFFFHGSMKKFNQLA